MEEGDTRDLNSETKYSLVKDRIIKAISPVKVRHDDDDDVVNHNGNFDYATVITEEGITHLGLKSAAPRRGLSAVASTPASQSSPRPESTLSQVSERSRNSLSSNLEPSETESVRNFGNEDEEKLSITSANDDDDVVLKGGLPEPAIYNSTSRPASAVSVQSKTTVKTSNSRPDSVASENSKTSVKSFVFIQPNKNYLIVKKCLSG